MSKPQKWWISSSWARGDGDVCEPMTATEALKLIAEMLEEGSTVDEITIEQMTPEREKLWALCEQQLNGIGVQ